MGVPALRIDDRILADVRSRDVPATVSRFITLKKAGRIWKANCPFHNEKSASFIVYSDHFHCFGCGAHGDAISFLMQHRGMSFHEAVTELSNGLTYSSCDKFLSQQKESAAEYAENGARRFDSDADERGRMAEARAIWQNAKPIYGTLGERYLRDARVIAKRLPPTLRFATGLYFAPARRELPALLAALQDSHNHIVSVQRIFLDPATGKKTEPAKEAKRTKGPMHDGAVRLGKPGRILGIAEGVETALSAAQIYSLPVWASLGAQRMKSITLPECVREVMIFRDNGEVGLKEAAQAAEIWEDGGRRVMIEAPPAEFKDWNDLLRAREGRR